MYLFFISLLSVIFSWNFASSKGSNVIDRKTNQIMHVEAQPQTLSTKHGISNLDEAAVRIQQLEERLREIELRVPKKYPEVKFLTYRDRKRILVRECFVLTQSGDCNWEF